MGNDRIKMTIEMQVTPAQGLTLQAMFEHWNLLSNIGSSRKVGFFVDGDGNFHPKCKIKFKGKIPKLTDGLRKKAIAKDQGGDRIYDFDNIAWEINP